MPIGNQGPKVIFFYKYLTFKICNVLIQAVNVYTTFIQHLIGKGVYSCIHTKASTWRSLLFVEATTV